MLKVSGKYGAIAALLMTAVIILPFWWQSPEALLQRMQLGQVVGYLTMLLAMGLIHFALREYRDKHRGGRLRFWEGCRLGVLTSVIAAGLFGLATVALYAAMGPERTDEFMRLYVAFAAGEQAAPEQLARAMEQYEAHRALYLNPWFQGLLMFATVLPIGLLVSLVSAWLLRRD